MKKTLTFYSIIFILFIVLQRGVGALTKVVLANSITPYEYGIITLVAISLPGMFQLVSTLNFFYILSHAGEGKNYFGSAMAFSLLITTLLAILLFIYNKEFFNYLNLPMERWELLYIVIISSLLFISITVVFQGLFKGLRIYSMPGIIMTLPSLFRLAVVFILVYIFNINSFAIVILIFALSNAIPLVYISLSERFRGYFSLIRPINIPSKRMFVFGSSLFIVGSFSSMGQYIIKIVLSHDLGVVWQGYYDVSLTIASVLLFSVGTMSYVSVPEATNPNKNTVYEKGGLGDVTRGLFSLLVLLIIILYFYADYIVAKFFSEDYILASEYVFILAIGYLFNFIQIFLANLNLSFTKNSKDYIALTIRSFFLLPLFFFLTRFLIDFFEGYGYGNGFVGAYISYTALLILYTLLTIHYSSDLSPLKILLHRIDRLIASLTVTFLFLYYIDPPVLIGVITSITLFTLLIISSGYLSKTMFLEIIRGSKPSLQ